MCLLNRLPAEGRPDADEDALDQEEDGGAQRGRQRVHARLLALLVIDAAPGIVAAPGHDDDVSAATGFDAAGEEDVAAVGFLVVAAKLELVADVDHARYHQLSKRGYDDVIMYQVPRLVTTSHSDMSVREI